jgi:hypothetical protein
MQTYSAIEYRSASKLSLAVFWLLAAQAVIEGVNTLLTLGQLYFPNDLELDSGEFISVWVMVLGLVALLQLPIAILTIVFFLMWMHRSYKNLTPLGAHDLDITPGWAIGFWFIPIMNLFKPFQAVREIWNQSDPDADPQLNFLTSSVGTPAIIGGWWALWIASNVFSNLSVLLDWEGKKENAEIASVIFGIASILSMFAAIAAMMVVKGISERQTARYEKMGFDTYHSEPPPPPNFA